ncbi:MAG: hypothetical protein MMC33_008519 [Icmadophila ericetorum]|nr:hypothetical protein [Icmadophila ericetorum]
MDKSDSIQVSFVVTSLKDNKHPFEATSYHWGLWDSGHSIRVLSSNATKPAAKPAEYLKAIVLKMIKPRILVKDNLYTLLRRFRRKDRPVLLWIDALCIDQTHSEEKNLQVSKMAEIYSKAENVYIWLGEGDGKDTDALNFTKRILDLTDLDQTITDPCYVPRWNALSNLMKRPWFSRRWVIQEFALARNAMAIFVAKFDSVREVFRASKRYDIPEDLGEVVVLGANVLVNASSNLFRRSAMGGDALVRAASLDTLMADLSSFEAIDPRDTVYALLSIAKEYSPANKAYRASVMSSQGDKASLIQADYSKSTKNVYIDFTDYCISSGSLDIICRPWVPTVKLKQYVSWVKRPGDLEADFPSWLPHLSEAANGGPEDKFNGRVNGDTFVGLPDNKFYKAPRPTRAKFWLGRASESDVKRALQGGNGAQHDENTTKKEVPKSQASRAMSQSLPAVNGAGNVRSSKISASDYIGIGKKVKPVPPPKPIYYGILSVRGLQIDTIWQVSPRVVEGIVGRECLKMGGWQLSQEVLREVPEELWRTMIADRGPIGRNVPSWYHRAYLHCLANSTTNGDLNTEVLIKEAEPSMVVEFLKRVQRAVWNGVFIRSKEKKLFELSPWRTEPGDIICILLGCSVPVILRKHEHKNRASMSYYKLIGEAYIHSMMDGEALMNKSEAEFSPL